MSDSYLPDSALAADTIPTVKRFPSRTYRLDAAGKRIIGTTDGIEAMKQAIYLILHTERFANQMYSWNYGTELRGLTGKPKDYVYTELKRRITEALLQDDRIQSVDGFEFMADGSTVHVNFTVHTIFGDSEDSVDV